MSLFGGGPVPRFRGLPSRPPSEGGAETFRRPRRGRRPDLGKAERTISLFSSPVSLFGGGPVPAFKGMNHLPAGEGGAERFRTGRAPRGVPDFFKIEPLSARERLELEGRGPRSRTAAADPSDSYIAERSAWFRGLP